MKIFRYPSVAADKKLKSIIGRAIDFRKADLQAVTRILNDVKRHGDSAVVRYSRQFDAPDMTAGALTVTPDEMAAAGKKVDRPFVRALNRAAAQIERFHRQQLPKSWIDTHRPGTLLGQMVHPVDAAGVYVPGAKGGSTPLVSSVLMGGIPAKIAGVPKVVMATPPMPSGEISPYLLVAAKKVGVDAVYKMGSAWAIGALAYGTESVPGVNVIVGPGNIYVTLAKKIVAGTVGIDMIAGPSEILILADRTADPRFSAADLLSQAEHDPLASAILVTDDADLAQAVQTEVEEQLLSLARVEIARQSVTAFGAILVVDDLETAIALANRIAPEHLELQVADPMAVAPRLRNAGAVFLGHYTPEPVGDYVAGPNHVLPTAGTARFSSALSVEHFIKKTSLISYSPVAFRKEARDIITLAGVEGLGGHANAIQVRLSGKKND
ncbi:histidinol dehydrogenase [Desulfosarcina ovata subsp. sediminis]|uniref:Histidinol dehydrogenase n=1 Tax=Desulfosarcina ovata subsp. sediminis TaxID=885957 RepID=A0A5K7ZRY0_9BACT|nr:histidinol dehydrogenase [Desulfosarcina ovata]BBO82969.1 histidinol dehydrogenase [Desulfosarcina ovata subsp. sediminis]